MAFRTELLPLAGFVKYSGNSLARSPREFAGWHRYGGDADARAVSKGLARLFVYAKLWA
jgi:hypothetical protein